MDNIMQKKGTEKMKRWLSLLLSVVLVFTFGLFAMGSGESEDGEQGSGSAVNQEDPNMLGDYKVEISSCRLAKNYEGKTVAIVKFIYTNVSDDSPSSFSAAFEDHAYQDGVGLNEALFLSDSANYSNDNQIKELKKGSSLEVEVAYELNDETTDIEVEIQELISFDEKTLRKTFSIA